MHHLPTIADSPNPASAMRSGTVDITTTKRSQRATLVLNAAMNVLARLVTVASRFVLVPFMLAVLGRDYYGAWIIVGQVFAYSRFLDLGLQSSISRQVAVYLARREVDQLNRQVNAAAAYYFFVGFLLVVPTVVFSIYYPVWFEVDPKYASAARWMVLCSGLGLAATIPQNAYGAVLAGLQRFDVISGSQIAVDVLRLVLVLAVLSSLSIGSALVILAVIHGGSLLAGSVYRTVAARRLCPHVRIQPWRLDRSLLADHLTFGVSSVLYMMSIAAVLQLAQILAGALISKEAAADLNVASLFLITGHSFVIALGIGARAAASRYEGERNEAMLRELLLRSTRYSVHLTFAGILLVWLFCEPLLRLWIGDELDHPALVEKLATACRVMSIGYGAFWLALPAYHVLNGMGRHAVPAALAAAACVLSIGLVLIAVAQPGANIIGLSWALALPTVPLVGLAVPWYCCRQTKQPILPYVGSGFLVPIMASFPMLLVAWAFCRFAPAESWMALIGQGAACVLVLVPVAWILVLRRGDRRYAISSAQSLLRRRSASQSHHPRDSAS